MIKMSGFNRFSSNQLNLVDLKSEKQKVDGSIKKIQQSYKNFDKNIENSSPESINQKITLLEDAVKRHLDELLSILEKQYEFMVSTSSSNESKIVVQLLDLKTKEVKKEIVAEDFLKMTKYIEDIFYVPD